MAVDGGQAYRDAHAAELDKHVLAMESDNGVVPARRASRFVGTDSARRAGAADRPLLSRIGATGVAQEAESPEADIGPLVRGGRARHGPRRGRARATSGTTTAEGDTLDKLDPARSGAAAWRRWR